MKAIKYGCLIIGVLIILVVDFNCGYEYLTLPNPAFTPITNNTTMLLNVLGYIFIVFSLWFNKNNS